MPVEIHLEQLVLDGFDPRDRHRIAGAVESGLARLFENQSVDPQRLAAMGDRLKINAGRIVIPAGGSPDGIGAQIASAVFEGLCK